MIPSIPCISKRLDAYLDTQVEVVNLPNTVDTFYYYRRQFQPQEWLELSPAQLLIRVIDPALKAMAEELNKTPKWKAGTPEMIEYEGVYCLICKSGKIPMRIWYTHDKARDLILLTLDCILLPA